MEHREEALFEAFVVSNKRQRYLGLLATKRGRDKIRAALDHFDDLDPRFCKQVASSDQSLRGVLRILRGLGAPSQCYVMSSHSELDGREMDLAEALAEVIGRSSGTLISCVSGRLAYFEGEEPKRRFICHRESQR
jgi:hypothetical protein